MTEDKKQLILLMEDDPFLVEMYTKKFEEFGYDIEVSTNGKTGLEIAKTKNPVVIILDVVMPEVDGFEVLKTLKNDSATKDIPVIMLTNLGQKEDIDKAMELGASDYMIKAHFTPSEVVVNIKKMIDSLKPTK